MIEQFDLSQGRRLSFFQLMQESAIEIPMIQRDYAQGREEEHEVRDTFLNALFHYVTENTKADLDFIYGATVNEVLIPLDGQQRLTTLFLLHWYLANKEQRADVFSNVMKNGHDAKFRYKTRVSSHEFCQQLVSHTVKFEALLPADKERKNSFSKTIRNAPWFYRSWNNDPTICGMLNMLDAIHNKFFSYTGLLFDNLTNDEAAISFLFLDMQKSQLPEELYIKMNARGLPLTAFENFKAKLEQHIKDLPFNKTGSYTKQFGSVNVPATVQEYFSFKIDNSWSNFFWDASKGQAFDKMLMNFFRVVITNCFASQPEYANFSQEIKLLLGKDDANEQEIRVREITFYEYQSVNALTEKAITDTISFLDVIADTTPQRIYLDDQDYIDERKLIFSVLQGNLDYEKRVLFYGFYKYIAVKNCTKEQLSTWVRILYNLTTNTIFNNSSDFSRAITGIDRILAENIDVLELLKSNWPFSGFSSWQIEEERIKAHLITRGFEWKELVLLAEKHKYFSGQIGFLLVYSGVRAYYSQNGNCSWTQELDTHYFNEFNKYYLKSASIFGATGLLPFKDFLFERALLCIGNYLLGKGRNKSFLVARDRDVSWKRLLRGTFDDGSTYVEIRSRMVKKLLDEIEPASVEVDLQRIIDEEPSNTTISKWQRCFINYPEAIEACRNRYVRFVDNSEDHILLLDKSSTNGRHKELFTYSLKSNLERHGNNVKYAEQNSIDLSKFIFEINGMPIRITYENDENDWCYWVNYKQDTARFNSEADVVEYLKNLEIIRIKVNVAIENT